ncbi:MAG: hypothetical protein V1872_02370 [bacterium]
MKTTLIIFFLLIIIIISPISTVDAQFSNTTPFATAIYKFPGAYPTGIAFDGEYFWVADILEKKIYKFSSSNGKLVKTIPSPGICPTGLAWDGNTLWNINSCEKGWNSETKRDVIYRLNPENGSIIMIISAPGQECKGLTWDGGYLWISDSRTRRIYKINPENGKVLRSISAPGKNPGGLAWDGQNLWNTDLENKKIYKLDPLVGSVVGSFPSPSSEPYGLAYYDQYLWHTDKKEDKVYKLCFNNSKNRFPVDQNIPINDEHNDKIEVVETVSKENDEKKENNKKVERQIYQDSPVVRQNDNVIQVEGLAFFNEDKIDRLQEGEQTIREAEDNAYRKLFQVIYKIKVDKDKTVEYYIKQDDKLRQKIQYLVSKAAVVDRRYLEMGARVILRINLNGQQNSLEAILGKGIK